MNVAIIDSSVCDRIKTISMINKIAQNKNFDVNISEFCGGDEFLFAYKHQFDVIFMDTEMSKKMELRLPLSSEKLINTYL